MAKCGATLPPRSIITGMAESPRLLLSIGGSDSGGAAGIQADLKTWTALGAYGMSVITAVTAQNSVQVAAVESISAEFVTTQLKTVLSDYGLNAVKTGFLGRVEVIRAVAQQLRRQMPLVVDPVLVNQFRIPMFESAVTEAYKQHLFPLASVITPNSAEAELLAEMPIDNLDDARKAVQNIYEQGVPAVLLTGFPAGNDKINILYNGKFSYYPAPRIDTINVHGSGDTLSAAIAFRLAEGDTLSVAIEFATDFTLKAIDRAKAWRLGEGHGPLAHF